MVLFSFNESHFFCGSGSEIRTLDLPVKEANFKPLPACYPTYSPIIFTDIYQKMGRSQSLFLNFRLFNTVDNNHMFNMFDWFWIADLWCRRRPLYQLSHNHYPRWILLPTHQYLSTNWLYILIGLKSISTELNEMPIGLKLCTKQTTFDEA